MRNFLIFFFSGSEMAADSASAPRGWRRLLHLQHDRTAAPEHRKDARQVHSKREFVNRSIEHRRLSQLSISHRLLQSLLNELVSSPFVLRVYIEPQFAIPIRSKVIAEINDVYGQV